MSPLLFLSSSEILGRAASPLPLPAMSRSCQDLFNLRVKALHTIFLLFSIQIWVLFSLSLWSANINLLFNPLHPYLEHHLGVLSPSLTFLMQWLLYCNITDTMIIYHAMIIYQWYLSFKYYIIILSQAFYLGCLTRFSYFLFNHTAMQYPKWFYRHMQYRVLCVYPTHSHHLPMLLLLDQVY